MEAAVLPDLVVLLGTLVTVGMTVLVHYEGLAWLARRAAGRISGRGGMLAVIFGVLSLHVVEIWIFGAAWWALVRVPDAGHVIGSGAMAWHEAGFVSALIFTSLGFDALDPVGAIRLLVGAEALTGLVLITWSASFTYLEMSRHWSPNR